MFVTLTVMPNDDPSNAPGANIPYTAWFALADIVRIDWHMDAFENPHAPQSTITLRSGQTIDVGQTPSQISPECTERP